MPIISSWFLWRTSTSWPQQYLQPLNLYHSWPILELKDKLFIFFHLSTNKRRVVKIDPMGVAVQQRTGHHSWLLYQLVVTVMGSSLPPRQWLLYFPTCQVNICEQALALEAVCKLTQLWLKRWNAAVQWGSTCRNTVKHWHRGDHWICVIFLNQECCKSKRYS